jgi:hypothetical protein
MMRHRRSRGIRFEDGDGDRSGHQRRVQSGIDEYDKRSVADIIGQLRTQLVDGDDVDVFHASVVYEGVGDHPADGIVTTQPIAVGEDERTAAHLRTSSSV